MLLPIQKPTRVLMIYRHIYTPHVLIYECGISDHRCLNHNIYTYMYIPAAGRAGIIKQYIHISACTACTVHMSVIIHAYIHIIYINRRWSAEV